MAKFVLLRDSYFLPASDIDTGLQGKRFGGWDTLRAEVAPAEFVDIDAAGKA